MRTGSFRWAEEDSERGTVAILAAAVLALALMVVVGLAHLGQVVVSQARAQLAADAAALGAAAERAAGGDCRGAAVVAVDLASANGARLHDWRCWRRTVAVEVVVTRSPPLGQVRAVAAAEIGKGLVPSVPTRGEGFRPGTPNTESASPFRAPEWLVRT